MKLSGVAPLFFALFAMVLAGTAAAACGVPRRDVAAADVPKLTSLTAVMEVQSTVADPQLKKANQATFAEADYAAFVDLSERIQATSTKVKEFSKGPAFDKLADKLHETAVALGKAAAAKDAKASASSLGAMKATCDECHNQN